MRTKIIFVTGTDTGVGKTLLTALLLCHLRSHGARALALKPFCSGGRGDAELLLRLQNGDITLDEINPFYFPEPVAPLVSARKHKRRISLEDVVNQIHSVAERLALSSKAAGTSPSMQNYLLIEGSGGLLVPLGEGFSVGDLIAQLACDVLVVSRNRLGTINHTLLTAHAVISAVSRRRALAAPGWLKVLLMDRPAPDISSATNPAILAEMLKPIPLLQLPFLGRNCMSLAIIRKTASKFHKVLGQLVLRG